MAWGGVRRSSIQSARNRRRQGKLSFVLPWVRRFGFFLTVCVALSWLGAWIWLSGSFEKFAAWSEGRFVRASVDLGFSVQNILVEGRVNTDPDVLMAITSVGKGDPLFAFSLQAMKDKLEKIEWVESARVERRLPDTIYVTIKERVPIALWRVNGQTFIIDRGGKKITSHVEEKFRGLIEIDGDGAPQNAYALLVLLKAEPVISRRVRAAQRVDGRRWNVVLDNGLIVKLPEQDAELALRRLSDMEKTEGLLDKALLSLDLREPNRVVVMPKPGGAQSYIREFGEGATNAANNI